MTKTTTKKLFLVLAIITLVAVLSTTLISCIPNTFDIRDKEWRFQYAENYKKLDNGEVETSIAFTSPALKDKYPTAKVRDLLLAPGDLFVEFSERIKENEEAEETVVNLFKIAQSCKAITYKDAKYDFSYDKPVLDENGNEVKDKDDKTVTKRINGEGEVGIIKLDDGTFNFTLFIIIDDVKYYFVADAPNYTE